MAWEEGGGRRSRGPQRKAALYSTSIAKPPEMSSGQRYGCFALPKDHSDGQVKNGLWGVRLTTGRQTQVTYHCVAKRRALKVEARERWEALDLVWALEVKIEGLRLDKGKFSDLVTFLDVGLRGSSWWYICYHRKDWKEAHL